MRFSGLRLVAAAALLLLAPPAWGEAGKWSGSLGFSFNSTTGNSSTSSLGAELGLKLTPNPWGMEAALSWLRSENAGTKTADRLAGRVRGQWELDESWVFFVGLAGERDTFAGFDLRAYFEAGATYKVLLGPKHELSVDGGLTRTHEERIDNVTRNFWGGLAGVSYAWHFSANATLTERAVLFPNFNYSSDWRVTSDTAVQAKLTDLLALKVAYQVKYSNQPPADKRKTDTATLASVVVSF
jgi:putative salt-induced outer membrane protein